MKLLYLIIILINDDFKASMPDDRYPSRYPSSMPGRYPYDRPGMNGMNGMNGGYPDYGKK